MSFLDVVTPAPKRTPEETQQIVQAVKDYNNALDDLNVQVKTAVGNNQLLPDTATYLYNLIIGAQKWLTNNPRSDVSAIQINLSSVQQQFKTIMGTEQSRNQILVHITLFASLATELLASKSITDAQQKELISFTKSLLDWYNKNKYTATNPEYATKIDAFNGEFITIINGDGTIQKYKDERIKQIISLNKTELVKASTDALNKIGLTSPSQTPAEAKKQISLEKTALEAAIPPSAPAVITSTATQVFSILFLIFLILLGGSFAANLAIGRTIPYRVLYFLYGCIPFFSPFVILYVIYLRIRYGPIPLYGIFPLSTEPATTRLGKLLWYPFYWIPDGKSTELEQEFLKSLIV